MNKLLIYTDGGARGNPGPAACGVVIKNENGETVLKTSKYLGVATNNQAEYEALILALQKAKGIFKSRGAKFCAQSTCAPKSRNTKFYVPTGDKTGDKNIECYLDSELVVKHLNHEYKIKDENLQPLFIKVWNLTLDFDCVKFTHISREENKLADELVNGKLDEQGKNKSLF